MIDKKSIYKSSGYIYILTNKLIPNIYKIGFTTREPLDRANEISRNTGIPGKYQVLCKWWVQEAYKAERAIFKKLKSYQIDQNELFLFENKTEKEVIEKVSEILKGIQVTSSSVNTLKTAELTDSVSQSKSITPLPQTDNSRTKDRTNKKKTGSLANVSSIIPDVNKNEIRHKVNEAVTANYFELEAKYNISLLYKKQLENEANIKINDLKAELLEASKYTLGLMVVTILLFLLGDGVNTIPMVKGTIIFGIFCILCFTLNYRLKVSEIKKDLSSYSPEEIKTDLNKLELISCYRHQINKYCIYGLNITCRLKPPFIHPENDSVKTKLFKSHRIEFNIAAQYDGFKYETNLYATSEEEALINFIKYFRKAENKFKANL